MRRCLTVSGMKISVHSDGLCGWSEVKLLSDFISFLTWLTTSRSTNIDSASITWLSPVVLEVTLKHGKPALRNSVSRMGASSMLDMALGCPSVTRTTLRWSSSHRPPRSLGADRHRPWAPERPTDPTNGAVGFSVVQPFALLFGSTLSGPYQRTRDLQADRAERCRRRGARKRQRVGSPVAHQCPWPSGSCLRGDCVELPWPQTQRGPAGHLSIARQECNQRQRFGIGLAKAR